MFKVGDLVRYAAGWCKPEESGLLHVVREIRLNPVKGTETRALIETINGSKRLGYLNPVETVDFEMIEKVEG